MFGFQSFIFKCNSSCFYQSVYTVLQFSEQVILLNYSTDLQIMFPYCTYLYEFTVLKHFSDIFCILFSSQNLKHMNQVLFYLRDFFLVVAHCSYSLFKTRNNKAVDVFQAVTFSICWYFITLNKCKSTPGRTFSLSIKQINNNPLFSPLNNKICFLTP